MIYDTDVTSLKILLYTPDWLISFKKEIAGKILIESSVGEVVHEYRKKYGLSQKKLAELMEIRRESISRIENNTVNPKLSFIRTFINMMALIEVVRVMRAKHKKIDVYFLENLAKEYGVSIKKLHVLIKLAVENYDKKLIKIKKSLMVNKYGK